MGDNRETAKLSICLSFDVGCSFFITQAIKYLNIVIPAKAGIQESTGCRIKSGMTELDYLIARLITFNIHLLKEGL